MNKKKIVALGIAFVLVYAVGFLNGDASAIKKVNEKISTKVAQSSTPVTAPAAVPASTPAPTPTPVVAAEKKWAVTNTWSGNGAKDTENFAVTENTRINWETTNAQGIFQIYVQDKDGVPAAVAANMQGIGKDVSYLHITPGQYSLKVNAANTPWKITVEQQQ